MILDYISLQDVGVFAGRHKINLTYPNPSRPVVLFGGLNGAGKTTLLESIQLGLLGASAPFVQQDGENYQSILRRLVNKKSRYRHASIEISFHRFVGGQREMYRVVREWHIARNGVKEELSVYHNQHLDRGMSSNWATHVETFFPLNIAHFFFFDGEKVEQYASPDTSAKMIADAVNNLLGIDVIHKLQKDLATVIKRRKVEKAQKGDKDALKASEQKAVLAQESIDALLAQKAGITTHQLNSLEGKIAQATADYKKIGGDLADKEAEIREKIAYLTSQKEECVLRLQEIAGSVLPLALVAGTLQRMLESSANDNQISKAKTAAAILDEYAARLSKHMEDVHIDKKSREEILNFTKTHASSFNELADQEIAMGMSQETHYLLEQLLANAIPEAQQGARVALDKHDQIKHELEGLESQKNSIPDSAVVDEHKRKKEEHESARANLLRQVADLDIQIAAARREREKCQAEHDDLVKKIGESLLREQDNARFVTHAEKAQEILVSFERAIVQHHIHRIERLVLESYLQLLRKSTLLSDVKIDMKDFSIRILDEDKKTIAPSQLSAGERQLLAIALLWGLAKASGKPLPVAIDTPMGRLDSEHRAKLINGYFPNASHQVLLFSTDEEITGEYYAQLEKSIGRTYHLVYDDKSQSTNIAEGYF